MLYNPAACRGPNECSKSENWGGSVFSTRKAILGFLPGIFWSMNRESNPRRTCAPEPSQHQNFLNSLPHSSEDIMQNWLLQSLISARRFVGRARVAPVALAAAPSHAPARGPGKPVGRRPPGGVTGPPFTIGVTRKRSGVMTSLSSHRTRIMIA